MPPVTNGPQSNIRKLELDEISRINEQVTYFKGTKEVKNGTASYMHFIDKYRAINVDLVSKFGVLETTKTDMKKKFFESQEHGPMAQFMELALLLANKEGSLGPHIQARITRTAKPDDEGNSFVDVVVELKNTYIEELAKTDKKFKDVRPVTTLLVDVTTNPNAVEGKEEKLVKYSLDPAKKASVLCFENKFGVLGIEGAKTVAFQSEEAIATVSKRFRTCLAPLPGGGFSITDQSGFDKAYQDFFSDFLSSVSNNAQNNLKYLSFKARGRPFTKDETALADSYKSTIDFIEAYKKTPTI